MEKYIKTNGKVLASVDQFPGVTPELLLARQRIGVYDTTPSVGKELDVPAFFGNVRALEKEINAQLIKMDEAIHVMMLSLISGDNSFFLSLPGAAKTTMARMLGNAVEGEFFRKNFTPDMSASDLFGPFSAKGMQNDKWTRNWSGLAKASIALCDEFYKGSQSIQHNTLDVAEERTVSDPHGTYNVPLLTMLGASNEVTGADPRNATWDRWIYRLEVGYPNRKDEILAALDATSGRKPITVKLEVGDVLLCQALVEYMSMNLPPEIKNKMADILIKLGSKGIEPSPRRWFGWARAIVAETMLVGGKIKSDALLTGANILWINPSDKDEVVKIVGGTSSPERAAIMSVRSDLEKIRNDMSNISDMNEITQIMARVKSYGDQIERRITSVEYEDAKKAILADVQQLRVELMDAVAQLADKNKQTN